MGTFFTIYKLSTYDFLKWMQQEGLLLSNYTCIKCGEQCKMYAKKSAAIGYSFRCPKNKNHEKTILTNSYFKHGNVYPQDVLLFIRSYLIGLSNVNCCSETSIGQDTGGSKSISLYTFFGLCNLFTPLIFFFIILRYFSINMS